MFDIAVLTGGTCLVMICVLFGWWLRGMQGDAKFQYSLWRAGKGVGFHCPGDDCDGEMYILKLDTGRSKLVYECRKCGKKWIDG